MLTKNMRIILGEEKYLGNRLHSHYICHLNTQEQIKAKEKFENLLNKYSDEKFIEIGFDSITKKYIKELIQLKEEPTWEKVMKKFFKGMIDLLNREINNSSKIPKPKDIKDKIKKEIKKIHIYHKEDIIKIDEKKGIIKIDYISKRYSPKYGGKFKPWRDTEFIFTLNFEKNLFIWDYINILESLRRKGMGTKISKFCEDLAKDLGFSRFTVEYPNRKYWLKKMKYDIPYKYRIGSGEHSDYTLEGYKTN